MKNITIYILMLAWLTGVIPSSAQNAPKRVVGIGGRVYTLPVEEADALEFIYHAIPLSDYMMYTPEVHLKDIRASLRAKREMPWAKSVPENIWKHFVLPSRVDSEYLDNFRASYYNELHDRTEALSMKESVAELAHWLRERVEIFPVEGRIASPKSAILNAAADPYELAILAVSALRTLDIPARIVYPRLDAQTSIVQVWVDGSWHTFNPFNLDLPVPGSELCALVYGDYAGPEKVLSHSKRISEIVVGNAPTLNNDKANLSSLEQNMLDAYTMTFFGEKHSPLPIAELNVRFGVLEPRVSQILHRARGNWNRIYDFLVTVPPERLEEAIAMLELLSDTNLQDTGMRVLLATINNTEPDMNDPLYVQYILNPQISDEILTDYRQAMHAAGSKGSLMSIDEIIKSARDIIIDNDGNTYHLPITPLEVWKQGRADRHSRDIFFVAQCRNNYIPAYLDPDTGAPKYHDGNDWKTISL
ncbi:MAG: transglutaminase-like domain-containing protein [Muribaculaceae bacterium]|nr:transglutaminase-like domain-containing protein [Muribaculaceae bacterium]